MSVISSRCFEQFGSWHLLPHWSRGWRQPLGWRLWASLGCYTPARPQNWSLLARTTSRLCPDSSGGLQSRPGQTIADITEMEMSICFWYLKLRLCLTWQADSLPPPAQTMVVFTELPHQSLRPQVCWSTTGSRACWSVAARGPPAEDSVTYSAVISLESHSVASNLVCFAKVLRSVSTVEATPACDVTGLVVGEGGTLLRQAGWLDLVTDDSTFLQFQEGDVVPT